jgi:hypothetical protein
MTDVLLSTAYIRRPKNDDTSPFTMPRLSRKKSKIRNKRLQKLAAAEKRASDDEQDMLTPEELTAIVTVLGTQVDEDQENPEISPSAENLDRFGAEAQTFFA